MAGTLTRLAAALGIGVAVLATTAAAHADGTSAGEFSMAARGPDVRGNPTPLPRPEWQVPGPMLAEAPGAQTPGADPFHLLLNRSEVQSDLGLTGDQLNRLARAARNFHTRLQELSYPKPGVSREQAQAAIRNHVMETRGMIARELNPEQLGRLQQIMLQIEGPCLAIMEPQMGRQLNITRDQGNAMGAACRARADQIRSAFRAPASGTDYCAQMAANRDAIEPIRSRSDEQVMTLLSPEQKSMFVQMTGRRLDLPPPTPPGCAPRA
jgi:hypothetical protein